MTKPAAPKLATRLIHPDYAAPEGFNGVNVPVHHASTVVFPNARTYRERYSGPPLPYVYGRTGTPTTKALAGRIAEMVGAEQAMLVPSGLSAISLVYLGLLKAGDHVLVADSVYGPSRDLAQRLLPDFGISATFYDPLIGAGIARLIQPNTRLVWVESPGSFTMEVQDLPAIAAAAHAAGALVAVDDTWSAGVLMQPFELGADIAVQAITKYWGGHSDLSMGAVSARDAAVAKRLWTCRERLGLGVGGDDAYLVLRGLQTLALRLNHQGQSALQIAHWLKTRPEVARVLHPALPDCPGHDIWRRDFTGASGLFAFQLQPDCTPESADAMLDALRYFRIGASWGGVESLAVSTDPSPLRTAVSWPGPGVLVRLSVGLEEVGDLVGDLEQAFARLRRR